MVGSLMSVENLKTVHLLIWQIIFSLWLCKASQ